MKTAWLTTVAVVLSVAAFGAETKCTSGSSGRKIEVVTGEGGKPPCEVKYTKEGETEAKTLWNAQNDSAFCTEKAAGLVDKLSSGGWKCEGDIAAAGKPEGAKGEPAKKEEKPAAEGKTEGN